MEYFDTIFFNESRAIDIAKQTNKIKQNSNKIQLCYYFGKKTKKNLISLDINNLKQFFLTTKLRWPINCDFIDSIFEDDDEKQNKIIKIIATTLEEVKNEKMAYLDKELKKYYTIIPKKNRVLIFATKDGEILYNYAKLLSKRYKKNGIKTKIVSETSKKNFIIDEVQTIDVFKTINSFKPEKIIFFNDFKPFMHHKYIKIEYFIDSFSKIYEIVDSEEKSDFSNIDIFVTNYYHKILLDKIKIEAKKFKFIKKFKYIKRKKTIDLLILDNYFTKDSIFFAFHSMLDDIYKYLDNKNFLDLDGIVRFIKEKTYYLDYEDWELNIFILKFILTDYFIKNLKTNKKVVCSGANWENSNTKYKISKKPLKSLSKAKYVLYINFPIITLKLDEIIANKAIPIVYDLREQDKFYDKQYDKKCIFFKNIDELNNILKKIEN